MALENLEVVFAVSKYDPDFPYSWSLATVCFFLFRNIMITRGDVLKKVCSKCKGAFQSRKINILMFITRVWRLEGGIVFFESKKSENLWPHISLKNLTIIMLMVGSNQKVSSAIASSQIRFFSLSRLKKAKKEWWCSGLTEVCFGIKRGPASQSA